MSKSIRTLLFVLVAFSLLLAACGSSPTQTPDNESSVPAEQQPATLPAITDVITTATPSTLECGPVIWDIVNGTCVDDIATFIVDGETILANIKLNGVSADFDIEQVNTKNHVNEYLRCAVNSSWVKNPGTQSIAYNANTALYFDINCTVHDIDSAFTGTIVWPVQAPLGLTLTAFAPTASTSNAYTVTPTATTAP